MNNHASSISGTTKPDQKQTDNGLDPFLPFQGETEGRGGWYCTVQTYKRLSHRKNVNRHDRESKIAAISKRFECGQQIS